MSRPNDSEQAQLSYIKRFNIMAGSALEEAECFVSSLKALQSSFNQLNSLPILERDLKETMDQYARLTMVCDVLKVFNPFTSPSPSPAHQAHTNTTTPSLPFVKVEAIDIKPGHLIGASQQLPSPQNTIIRNEADPASSAPSVSPNQLQAVATINQNKYADSHDSQVHHSRQQQVKPVPNMNMNNSIQATTTTTTTTNNNNAVSVTIPRSTSSSTLCVPKFGTNSNRTELKTTRRSFSDVEEKEVLSTTNFIEIFEAILTHFANSNKLLVDDTWEKLFVHSLPPQQKDWFSSNIQGKSYSWEHAKNIFYQEFDRNTVGNYKNNNGVIAVEKANGVFEGGSKKRRRT